MKLILVLLTLGFFRAQAQDTSFTVSRLSNKSIERLLHEKQLLIIGEVHGTKQIPALIYQLAEQMRKNGKNIQIGLEIDERNQPLVDRFLQSGDISILKSMDFFTSKTKDGRSSQAMAQLISQVRKLGSKLFLFDVKASTSLQRDSLMAQRISSHLNSNVFTIILVGNLHARQRPISFDGGQSVFKPMGYYLARHTEGKILSLNVAIASGQAWMCLEDGCRTHSLPAKIDLAKKYGAKTRIILTEIPGGYQGMIYLKKAKASPPFIKL